MKSIISTKKQCYICKTTENLEYHHIIHGNANRKISEKYGLAVYLCKDHHTGTEGVHGKEGKKLDHKLKRKAERKWLEADYNRSINDWIQIFGKYE